MTRERRAPVTLRAALVVLGILAPLAILEIGLRIVSPVATVPDALYTFHRSDPELGWVGRPDLRLRFRRPEFDTLVEHDGNGWRRPEPPPPAGATRRVLVLGDSFTWGWGVEQGELVTDELQRRLGSNTAVVNRSLTAYGTAQEYLLLRRELAANRYDAVVLFFFANDVADNLDDERGRRPIARLVDGRLVLPDQPTEPLLHPVNRFLKEHSRVFLFFYDRTRLLLRRWRGRDRPPPPAVDGSDIALVDLPGAELTAALLTAMRDLARSHGAAFFIVYVPDPAEASGRGRASPYARAVRRLVEDVCAGEHIPLIDLTPAFAARSAAGAAVVYPADGHWTAAGHRLAAELLAGTEIFADGGKPPE